MKITVDRDRCVGAGQCVLAAEKVFQQAEEDGLVVLLNSEPGADQEDAVREAELICPSGAVQLIE